MTDPKPPVEIVNDKMLHAAAGALAALLGMLADGPTGGLICAAMAGGAREAWNLHIQGTRWDWWDLAATVGGGVVAVTLLGAWP